MSKQVYDLHAGKGFTRGQSTEHLRNYRIIDPEVKKYGYFDPTRMHLNFEVTTGGKVVPVNQYYAIDRRFRDNLKRRGIKEPNEEKRKKGLTPNRNTIANIILGGSRDRMLELAFGDQKFDLKKGADNSHLHRKEEIEKWAVEMYNWVTTKYGEDNVVAFIVHLDEKNPHVHCTVIPVDEKGRISYNKIFGGSKENARAKFNEAHDEIAAINEKWNLKRGDGSTGRHKSSEEYWKELSEKCNRLEGSVEEQLALLRTAQRKAAIAEKSLSTMVQHKMQEIENLREDIEHLEAEKDINREQLNNEYERLTNLLQQLSRELEDKQEKFRIAQERLIKINEKIDELMRKQMELVKTNDEMEKVLNKKYDEYQDKIQDEMYVNIGQYFEIIGDSFMKNLQSMRDMLPPTQRQYFDTMMDTSFIEELVQHSNEIVAVATALFLGYVDQATEISVTAGGGGNPGTDVGRRKGEDDEDYKYRCFVMACMMTRPAQRKLNQSTGGWRR